MSTRSYCSFAKLSKFRHGFACFRTKEIRKPKDLAGITNLPLLWTKYKALKVEENDYKRRLMDELMSECRLDDVPRHIYEKIFLAHSKFGVLKDLNLIPDKDAIIKGMLSHLETFPFDLSTIKKNEDDLTIKSIRNEIEKQYLSWKYKVNVVDIEEILKRYRWRLFEFRSLQSLRNNIQALEKTRRARDMCVAEKIYHLTQQPFQVDYLKNFQQTIAGLNWQLIPTTCPAILLHPHRYIVFLETTLMEMDFTQKQIQEGLPFLNVAFQTFIRRLNHILTNPAIARYRNEEKFLSLLAYDRFLLDNMVTVEKASFEELTDMLIPHFSRVKRSTTRVLARTVAFHINQFYRISSDVCVKELQKHPKHLRVSEKQVQETLMFLKSNNFKTAEVEESLTIVLYPSESIQKALAEIQSEGGTLEKYGFKSGCLPRCTENFRHGTKERQKALQLCLYYLEQPFHFSGDGVWAVTSIEGFPKCPVPS